jgi:hypothetical protein
MVPQIMHVRISVCCRIIFIVCVHSPVEDTNYRNSAEVMSTVLSEYFFSLIINHNYSAICVSINERRNVNVVFIGLVRW